MNGALVTARVLFTREGAAAYLDVSPRTLDKFQADGRLVPRDLDGMKRFHRDDLDEFASRLPDWDREKSR